MKRMLLLLLALFFTNTLVADGEDYSFSGKHFIASYLDCDLKAIGDVESLLKAMDLAVNASGATILERKSHVFPPTGLTAMYILSESHASIHTYPEHGACFVDLFTCGEHCSAKEFDRLLRAYLRPGAVSILHLARDRTTEEIPLH